MNLVLQDLFTNEEKREMAELRIHAINLTQKVGFYVTTI